MDDARVFLGSGGGDAIDGGEDARRHFIVRASRIACTDLAHRAIGTRLRHVDRRDRGEHQQLGPAVPDTSTVPYDSLRRSSRRSAASGLTGWRRSSASR